MKNKILTILLILTFITSCNTNTDSKILVMPTPSLTDSPTETATLATTKPPTETPSPTKDPVTYDHFGNVKIHELNGEIKYTWFSYVPYSIMKSIGTEPIYILITCANATMSEDYTIAEESMRGCIRHFSSLAEDYEYILLTPVIPRDFYVPIYSVAFDRRVFGEIDPFFQRPDLEVIKMIEQLKSELAAGGIVVRDKVFIEGFSAGGMFAQRFALLHPELVNAIAGGQCGGALTLPITEYNGYSMDWPLGIADYEDLTGTTFKLDDYKKIEQMIYIGTLDNTNSTVHYGNEIWNDRQVDILNSFGLRDPDRVQKQVEFLNQIGFTNIHFESYSGIGHKYPDQVFEHIFKFFRRYKK